MNENIILHLNNPDFKTFILFLEKNQACNEFIAYQPAKKIYSTYSEGQIKANKHLKKLNLKKIITYLESHFPVSLEQDMKEKAIKVLTLLAQHIHHKYYTSHCEKVAGFIHSAVNFILGDGFCTTDKRIYQLIERLRTLNPHYSFIQSIKEPVIPLVEQQALYQHIDPTIISYHKQDHQTHSLIPCCKSPLAQGAFGKVYLHRTSHAWVVKKSKVHLEHEYQIGKSLDHPCFIKVHKLYIKTYEDQLPLYKLTMDKAEGETLADLLLKQTKFSNSLIEQIFTQLKDCCAYLVEKKIAWGDLNPGNVFIHEKGFTLVDYDLWFHADTQLDTNHSLDQDNLRTLQILLGLIQFNKSFISVLLNQQEKFDSSLNSEILLSIILPRSFFHCSPHIESSYLIYRYKKEKWLQQLLETLKETTNQQKVEFLHDYIDCVKVGYQQALSQL